MGVKSQLVKLKENWLLILLVVILLFVVFGGGLLGVGSRSLMAEQRMISDEMAYYGGSASGGYYYPVADGDFAPDEEERKVVTTSTMGIRTGKGGFDDAEEQLESIVSSTDSFLLNTNVRVNGQGKRAYKTGSYQLKVDTDKYDAVVEQLERLGEVTSFNENERDITGSYTKTSIEIAVEKERLQRYEDMYERATRVEDQLEINDRIFDQQRRIKYLEDSLTSMDRRVEYSTINLNLQEEQPSLYDVAFVKFASLVRTVVGSLNAILYFLFAVAPWALLIGLVMLIIRLLRKRKGN